MVSNLEILGLFTIIPHHLSDFWAACHTHSPKAGQGMNVSMMDSFNLSWKLAYHLNGLVPPGGQGTNGSIELLNSYEDERREIARELIEFDHQFSSMFSGQIGAEGEEEGLTHEQFLEVFSTGNGFTSGCGIEYPDSDLVLKERANSPVHGTDFLSGVLRPGRRLLNVRVIRHADGNPRDLQDGMEPCLACNHCQCLFACRFPLQRTFPIVGLDVDGPSRFAWPFSQRS